MLTLRPYQQNGVDAIRQSYASGKKAPLYVLPTGGGKTVVFSYIGGSVAKRNKRVWTLVHRVELLRQTSRALAKNGIDHGLINPKYTPAYNKPVQVASVQTLANRLKYFEKYPPDLIIIDEAHHANASTWRKIIEAFPQARILGVTATPVRGDGTGLGIEAGGMFDDLIIGPQIDELIKLGFLVKPKVFAPKERLDLTGLRTVRGDYDKQQAENLVDKPAITGRAVEYYQKLCPGAPAVAFCASVRHAEHVAAEFREAGFRSYSVDGSMEDEVRGRILKGLETGAVNVVTSCDLISEGTDIPAIQAAFLLRPTQSEGLFLQQVGRALRLAEGKDGAIIFDHVGNVINHGMPDEPRDWSLEGEKKRKKRKGDDEPEVKVIQCENCFLVHAPASVCPHCGYHYPQPEPLDRTPEQREGELREMTAEDAAAIKRARIKEEAQAKTYEDFVAIAQKRGYKPGWAKHRWIARQSKQVGI